MDTPLTERGENLSGGQRQRLALARALLHDSPVYIFDEASSNIDVDSENDIMAQIRALVKGQCMTKKAKVRIMITVTILMSIGFVIMHAVPVGRIVLGGVWVFHIGYFSLGVKTLPAKEKAE